MALSDCKLIQLPQVADPRGNLSIIEGGIAIPFDIRRVFYLYDVPGGSERGAHAHRSLFQFVVAMSGSFNVTLDDGTEEKSFHLNRSYYGLLISPMNWGRLHNFSSGAVAMVLASDHFNEADYIRDYDKFLEAVRP